MENNLNKKIEITIAGRAFPVKVTPEEESKVYALEKNLNQKIQDFQLMYKDKDKLDCVIMTLLTVALENEEQSADSETKTAIHTQLEKIEALLESNIL